MWMVVIFCISAQPKPPEIPILGSLIEQMKLADKINHLLAYAILGLLAWRSSGDSGARWRRFWVAVAVSAVYGATDEYHQCFVTGRSCDFWDWTADVTGASIGAMIISLKGGARTWQRKTSRTNNTK